MEEMVKSMKNNFVMEVYEYYKNPHLSNTVDLLSKYYMFIYYDVNCLKEKIFFYFECILLKINFFNRTPNTHTRRIMMPETIAFGLILFTDKPH